MIAKPAMITIPAHSTNRWSRNGQAVEYIVLHYVGAVSTAKNNAVYLNRDANQCMATRGLWMGNV